jgi:RNA polymerase sigma-70 factor (ECF subfamily)
MNEATRIVADLARGEAPAAEKLMPLVYEELRGLAAGYLRRAGGQVSVSPTTLVHEAYLRLVDQKRVAWNGRAHFMGVAAIAIRRLLVDHARHKAALKRGGAAQRIDLDDAADAAAGATVDLLPLDDALTDLARVHERQARVIELRFFGGLSVPDAAEVLGVSERTIKTDWQLARAWLRRELSTEAP